MGVQPFRWVHSEGSAGEWVAQHLQQVDAGKPQHVQIEQPNGHHIQPDMHTEPADLKADALSPPSHVTIAVRRLEVSVLSAASKC